MEEQNTIMNKKTPDDRSSGSLVNIGKGSFLLIAGGNREKTFNDFWYMNVNKSVSNTNADSFEVNWQEIKPTSNFNFQARFGHVGVVTKNAEKKTIVYLHGGQNYFESKHFADMIAVNVLSNNNKTPEISINKNYTEYPLNPKTTPRERNSHSVVSSSSSEDLYMFGGGSSEGLLNDLWNFNLNSLKWTKCDLTGEVIPQREMHGMICYKTKHNEEYLYIFGGRLYESIDNKIYRINTSTFNCELLAQMPIALCSFSYSNYKHFIIIYGGTDGITFFNDIIIYNMINQKWAKSKFQINTEFVNNDPSLMPFLGRIGSMMSIDESSETLVIFGGSSLHKDTNYTYTISLKVLLDENNIVPCSIN